MPWEILELDPEADFGRVTGVTSIAPFSEHRAYLHEQMDLSSGTPEIAKGNVDVKVAESGVALAIQMGPLLSRAQEREQGVVDVMNNFLYDLRKWVQAYESTLAGPMENIRWTIVFGDKIPVNRKERFNELMTLLKSDPPIVSGAWVRSELEKIGYEFPEDQAMIEEIIAEQIMFQQIKANVDGVRLDQELEAVEGDLEEEDGDEPPPPDEEEEEDEEA